MVNVSRLFTLLTILLLHDDKTVIHTLTLLEDETYSEPFNHGLIRDTSIGTIKA